MLCVAHYNVNRRQHVLYVAYYNVKSRQHVLYVTHYNVNRRQHALYVTHYNVNLSGGLMSLFDRLTVSATTLCGVTV